MQTVRGVGVVSLSDHFDGLVPVTVRCHECGSDVELNIEHGTAAREALVSNITSGLIIPLCGPCGIASQAERFLKENDAPDS